MIPSKYLYDKARKSATELMLDGFKVKFATRGDFDVQYPNITVRFLNKVYHFSDPSWEVVIKQLETLRSNVFNKI